MKKLFFTLVALLALSFSAVAQDTLSAVTLKSSYFYHAWPNFAQESIFMNPARLWPNHTKVVGTLFDAGDDTITIYGLAVSAETFNLHTTRTSIWENGDIVGYYEDSTSYYYELNQMYDTSAYEEAYELWGLYLRVADSLQRISAQLPVNVKLDTPTYYLDFGTYKDGSYTEMTPMLPVYELFFHNPVDVSGEFYMATTNRIHSAFPDCGREFYTWPIFTRLIVPSKNNDIFQGVAFYQLTGSLGPHWAFQLGPLTFGFPIIMPPDSNYVWDTTVVAYDTVVAIGDTIVTAGDTIVISGDTTIVVDGDTIFVAGGTVIISDTTIILDTTIVLDTAIVGGDTIIYYDTIIRYDTIVNYDTILGIEDHSLLQRLAGVMPNPAGKTAKVVSSFGMTLVEVYNMAGEKVHTLRLPDAPLTATLDVGRWPSGAYILRIHTPQGVAVKKLAVRH